jgi:hypothetical protein
MTTEEEDFLILLDDDSPEEGGDPELTTIFNIPTEGEPRTWNQEEKEI